MARACEPSTYEAEAEGLPQVWGQLRLHCKILSQKTRKKEKKELEIVEINTRYNLDAGLKNGKQNYHVLSHGVKV